MFDERLKQAFLKGEGRAMLFREMLHRSVRLGLYEAIFSILLQGLSLERVVRMLTK